MEGIVQWVKNITYYLLFVSLLSYLMPAGKVEKYVKLFFGAVFILLVISPLTGDLHLDTRFAQVYERIRFTQEQEEFQQKVWGIEEQQIKQIVAQYEEAVALNIREMAREAGIACILAGARIEAREEDERFGQVVEIALVIGRDEGEIREDGETDEWIFEEDEARKTAVVEKIQVVIGEGEGRQRERKQQNEGGAEEKEERGTDEAEQEEGVQDAVREFRREVAKYYGLEEEAVKITWEDD